MYEFAAGCGARSVSETDDSVWFDWRHWRWCGWWNCHGMFVYTSSSMFYFINITRAVRDCVPPPRRIWSAFRVCIRTPDPDYFRNLTGTSLSNDTSVIKFSRKSDHSLWRYKPNCGKMPYLAVSRILKKFLDLDPEADDCKNVISSSLCTATSVVKFLRRSIQ